MLGVFFVSEPVIEAEVVEERIVACPHCGRPNRLYKRATAGAYKCGACRAVLQNPFATSRTWPSMRNIGIAAAVIIALLVTIMTFKSKSPSHQASHPPAREEPSEVPRSGILSASDAYPGSTTQNEFTVINGSSHHAIAKVIDIVTDAKVLTVAIQAGEHLKIPAIPDGTYDVIFALGDRVYPGSDRFVKPLGFSKFDQPFKFSTRTTATKTEESTDDQTSPTKLEVTLTPVIDGNITTTSISQRQFERY
jgi:hypothetical protein